jgi:hypothetical protein
LHLLGYDHADAATEREMFELQAQLLRQWVKAGDRSPIRAPAPGGDTALRDTPSGRSR